MKRKYRVVVIVSTTAASVLFLLAGLTIGGVSWFGHLQAENNRSAEAEAVQRTAEEAAAARIAGAESNIYQALRLGEQGQTGTK